MSASRFYRKVLMVTALLAAASAAAPLLARAENAAAVAPTVECFSCIAAMGCEDNEHIDIDPPIGSVTFRGTFHPTCTVSSTAEYCGEHQSCGFASGELLRRIEIALRRSDAHELQALVRHERQVVVDHAHERVNVQGCGGVLIASYPLDAVWRRAVGD